MKLGVHALIYMLDRNPVSNETKRLKNFVNRFDSCWRVFVLEAIFDSILCLHWLLFWEALLIVKKKMVKPSIFVQYVLQVFK